jgi:hypothetical protein
MVNAPEINQNMLQEQQPMQQQPMQQQPMQQQPMQQPDAPAISQEEIEDSKRMIGLDVLEEGMKYDKNVAAVLQENPELTKEIIEKELAKLEEKDPAIAKQVRSSEAGMKMFAKGIMASVKPNNKPDEITDDSESSSQNGGGDELEEKVKSGKASKLELGEYLGRMKIPKK